MAILELCERARGEAFEIMVQHGTQGVTEVLAYGTAVVIEPVPR